MDSKSVENTPSQTALFTALRRALAHKRYQDESFGPDAFAEVFLPGYYKFFLTFAWVRNNMWKKLAAFMPGMNEYIIARTAFFDELFQKALQEGLPQIVLMGAGYDSRAYRFAHLNHGTTIYELDAPPTQLRKARCLQASRIPVPPAVQLIPINFRKETLGEALEKAGYQSQSKTLFLWEGVSYYLDQEAVKETLGFVGRSAGSGSRVAFDYTIPLSEENIQASYGSSQFMQSMQEHHANEAFLFSLPEQEMGLFLASLNLRLVEHLASQALEQKYLTDAQGVSIGHPTGNFRLVYAEQNSVFTPVPGI